MKWFIKTIIVGAVIIGIGLAVLLIALGLNGWQLTPNFTTEEFTAEEENSSLSVKLAAGRLKIEYYDGEKIYISYPVANGFETNVSENDGKLSYEGNIRRWYTFSCGVLFPETVVKIPENSVKNLDITLNAGTVDVCDGSFETVKIKVNAGTCNVGKISGAELLDIDLNAGTVKVDGISGQKLVCDVSAGSANVNGIDCAQSDVKVAAGSANVVYMGVKSDYTATVSVSAGSCNGLTSQTGGDKQITVRVSAGSCNVSFAG